MRGFGIRRLSPMLLVERDDYDKNDPRTSGNRLALPIGGNGLIEGNVEVRARFTESLLMAGFVDFGAVTRSRVPTSELGSVLWGVGVGFRYLTPIGPLRLDLAVRLPFGRPLPLFDIDGNEITYKKVDKGPKMAPTGNVYRDYRVEYGTENGDNIDRSCFGFGGGGLGGDNSWVNDGLCAFHLSIGEAF